MSELVTAHDPKKPETADRKITRVVIFPNSKKISKLGTEAQFHKQRRAHVVTRRGEAGGEGGGARV
jgi:ribosomal protein S12